MMPHAERAIVPMEKITEYLLSRTHAVGSRKAAFFRQFGFKENAPDVLRNALIAHAAAYMVSRELDSIHGKKYEVSGPLATPSGRLPMVKTVWMAAGGTPPRLVTAIPGKGSRQ